MRSTPLLQFLVWLGAAVQACICAAILYRNLFRQWASVFMYCAIAVAVDVAIAWNRPIYRRYFYLYWTWSFLAALLRLWILADVAASFPGADFIGPKFRLCVAAFAVTVGICAAMTTFHDGANYASAIVRGSFILDRCVAIAWGAFLAVVLVAIRLIGLGWHRTGALITNALIVKIFAGMAASYLFSFASPSGRSAGNYLLSVLSITSLAMWLWALSTHREESYNNDSQPLEQS